MQALQDVTKILFYRILVKHLDQFKDQASGVSWHIPSKFVKEMSAKSAVVSLTNSTV